MRRLVLLAILAGTAGCSDDGFQLGSGVPDTDFVVTEVGGDAATDGGGEDTSEEEDTSIGAPDSTIDDSSIVDGGPLPDTSIDTGKLDTGPFDTGKPDTGPFDTGVFDSGTDTRPADTGTFDSGTYDSGPYDSGTYDSGTFDSGSDATRADSGYDSGTFDSTTGDGGTCPMPPSTATPPSYSSYTCTMLTTEYQSALLAARACNCDADCHQEVPRDFCGCTIYVNPGNSAYPNLGAIRKQYETNMCVTACPLAPFCIPPTMKCVAGSSGKVCSDGSVATGP